MTSTYEPIDPRPRPRPRPDSSPMPTQGTLERWVRCPRSPAHAPEFYMVDASGHVWRNAPTELRPTLLVL